MANVFDEIAEKIGVLANDVQNEYVEACIEETDKSADKLDAYFTANSNSSTLNSHKDLRTIKTKDVYIRVVDWNDKLIVNELQGKSWGRDARKERARGKRNFSVRPATVHDLAYIINYGEINSDGTTKRLGTYFITKGMRRIKNKDKNIEKNFNLRLLRIAKRFE